MVQRTVLKIDLSCQKRKKKLMKSVSALEGVDKIEVDPEKGTLNVTGNADPYKIIINVRKSAGKFVEVVSVGPPPPPPKPAEAHNKPDDKKADRRKKEKEEAEGHNPPPPPPPKPAEAQKKQEDKKADHQERKKEEAVGHDPHTCRKCEKFVFVELDQGCNEPSPLCYIM